MLLKKMPKGNSSLKDALNPQRLEVDEREYNSAGAVGYILRRFYSPHWLKFATTIAITLVLSISQFFYAWCTRFAADEVIQVDRLAKAISPDVDTTLPTENRNFALPQENTKKSFSQRWDSYAGKTDSQRLHSLLLLLAIAAVWVSIDYMGNYFYGRFAVEIGQKVQYRMRHRVYDTLQALQMEYHDSQSVGAMLTSLFSDISIIQMNFNMISRQFFFNVSSICIGAGILLWLNPRMALITFCAFPFYLVVYKWFRSRLMVLHDNLRYREGSLNAHMSNRVRNFYLVKSYVNENGETLDFFRRSRKIVAEAIITNLIGSSFTIFCGLISGLSMVFILYYGTMSVKDGTMTAGELLMFYTSAGLLFNPVSMLSSLASMYQVLASRCAKIRRVLTEPVKIHTIDNPVSIDKNAPTVTFRNVGMKYVTARNNALENIDFELPAGKKLCIMGSSGSGKSTLAKLAGRIYDPTAGEILLNGIDIKNYKINELRKAVGYVNQEPVIFGGTLRENIRYGTTNAAQQEVISAARHAQIHEYIVRLPEKYETSTAERGQTLSGGQKQRVNLARVLLNGPKFLILDDCTSALDADTEARLIREFDTILRDRTAIIISHRIAMAMCCDYVLILEEGKCLEMDRLDVLLDREHSELKKMLDQQVKKAATKVFARRA